MEVLQDAGGTESVNAKIWNCCCSRPDADHRRIVRPTSLPRKWKSRLLRLGFQPGRASEWALSCTRSEDGHFLTGASGALHVIA